MNSSCATAICVTIGDNTYDVYESKFLDVNVKYFIMDGANMFHVKTFVDSYNETNDEPIIEFKKFLQYEGITDYLKEYYKFINHTTNIDNEAVNHSDARDIFDENGYWNIPKTIIHCYTIRDNTRGYWVSGEVLSRYAQRGNIKFAVMVDHLIAAIATFNEQKMNEALKCLTLDKEKMQKRIEYFKTECNHMTNYMKPEIGKDYVAYVEWIANKNELYIGSMDKKKFLNIRAKKDEQGNPLRYFIYAKDNKFGIQLRDLYRDCLIDLFGDMVRVNKCHLTFIPKVNLNNIQWRVRNCMQRIRVAATVPEV